MRKGAMIVTLSLVGALCVVGLSACGGSSSSKAQVSNDGKVLNAYVWNNEFIDRVTDNYPGYEAVDATTGTIGDVTVKWNITPNENNVYQTNLDNALLSQDEKAADEKVDLFLIEADDAAKYVDADCSVPLSDLGVDAAAFSQQFKYTQDVVTDSKGKLKGSSWQACPGLMTYRRDIAKEVLGTDDPSQVQAYVSDWSKFDETAQKMQEKGYKMTSSPADTYRLYSNNATHSWVENGEIVIDDNLKAWVDQSLKMVEADQTNTYDLWSDDWKKGFYTNSNVFCYFGPAWFVDYSMAADTEGTVAHDGGWAVAEGPQSYYWGGTWICAANGTDNADLVADIITTLCSDEEAMSNIAKANSDFVNNKAVVEGLAADSDFSNPILGGQNPMSLYLAGVERINLAGLTAYDQACNEEFQSAMMNYFKGSATYDEALDLFYKAVYEKHPELKK